MQFACLSIVFDNTKFQPRSVSHSGKTSPPGGNQERSVGEIFLKLCEPYEAKLLQQVLLPSVQYPLQGFRRAMLVCYFTAVLPAAYSFNIACEHCSAKSMQRILHRW